MNCFDASGHCLFGRHKGVHASKLPVMWVAWAKENVRGFASAFVNATDPPKARDKPAGRRYILDRSKRYIP